ncbi:hypothetical protein UXA24_06565 [Aeromonas caviae]|uniref:Uncharacterized protein n=1 Tax=Aeromonas caviae TaxID=648 RepID=A0AA42VA70_AERCA|nr:hypothetical protein [Aeromonas caviae]MDH1897420.1 hypothetical protein [Aeromonas caviae]MDY7840632.1 hypothetical protein [Aeromonas caviae]
MHTAVLTAGQIFINDLTNKVSWAVRLTHGSPQKCVTGGRCAGWHPHTPAVKPGMIPHYAPCLNLNLANSGHWRTKNGETGEIAEILVKKSPARGGVSSDEKQTKNTQQRFTRRVNLSQTRWPSTLGKAGLATHLALWIEG